MKNKVAFWLVILVQIMLVIICFSRQGNIYYWDTFYSFQNLHYASNSTPKHHYIVNDEDFREDEWMEASFVKDKLVVEREKSVLKDAPLDTMWNLFNRPYWTIVSALQAIFVPGQMIGWPAIVFNIVLFVLTQIMLYKLTYKYRHDHIVALLAITLFGFSGMIVSITTYIRFYMFSCFLCMVFIFLHSYIWEIETKKWYKILLLEAIAFLCAKWSIDISQLSLFLVLIFIVMYYALMIANKCWKKMVVYSFPLMAGVYYIFAKTKYVNMLINMKDVYDNSNGPVRWVLEAILTLNPIAFVERIVHESSLIAKYAFGFTPVFIIFVIISIYCLFLLKKNNHLQLHPIESVMMLTLVSYFVVASAIHFYTEARYSSQGWILLSWLSALIMAFFYKNIANKKLAGVIIATIIIAIIVGSATGKRVVYVLEDGAELDKRLSAQQVQHTVVTYYGDCGESNDTIYQAVTLIDDDSYFIATANIYNIADSLPNEFMLATRDYSNQIDDCLSLGYDISWKETVGLYEFYYLFKED